MLTVDVKVNGDTIYWLTAQRMVPLKDKGQLSNYKLTVHRLDKDKIPIEIEGNVRHTYNQGALQLVERMCGVADTLEGLADLKGK